MAKRSFVVLLLLCIGLMVPLHLLSAQQETILTLSVPAWREDIYDEPGFFAEFEAQFGAKVVLVQANEETFFAPAAYDLEQHLESAENYASSADVLYVSNDNLSIEATRAGLFLDLTPLTSGDPNLNPEDFFASAYESFQWDRGVWGLPVSMDVQIIIYDPAAFDAARLEYPNESWTLDDYANADRLLTEYDEDGAVTLPGFGLFGSNRYLLRSLLGHGFFDPNGVPQQPRFTDSDTLALLASWIQYQEEGLLGGAELTGDFDFQEIPLTISGPFELTTMFRPGNAPVKAGALLPGGTAGLRVEGFAVSAGTNQPELAYELTKWLTSEARVVNSFFGTSPARRSMVGVEPEEGDEFFFRPEYSDETQALIDSALENALSTSELRFADYIDRIVSLVRDDGQDLSAASTTVEAEAAENLQIALDRRGAAVLAVPTPVPTPVLSAGEVSLNFGMTMFINPLPNQDRWDQVIAEFTASDPEVRQIVIDSDFTPSLTQMAEEFDCFYLPYNAVNADDIDSVLSLDPFLDADLNFDSGDIIGNVLAQMERDNRTWAYPLNLQPSVLWYQSELFAEAGIPAPDSGWTTDSFIDALRSLKIDSDDPVPFQPREFGGNYILMLAAAFGGLPIDYRTQPPTLNFADPANIEALRQVLDLAKAGYIQYSELATFGGGFGGGGSDIPIYNETLSPFSFNRFQFQGEGAETEDPYRITSYPAGSQYTPVTYSIGTAYISASSLNPEACYRWISSLSEHPELFMAMPARRSQLNNPEMVAALGVDLSAFYQQYEAQLQAPNVIEFTSAFGGGNTSPGDFITQFWLNRAMDRYVMEDANLETELAEAGLFASDYQTCIADIPPFDPANFTNQEEQINYFRQFTDCAISVDPSMEEIFGGIFGASD